MFEAYRRLLKSLSNIYGKADDEQSKELLRHAIKLGLTFWDTYADLYYEVWKIEIDCAR